MAITFLIASCSWGQFHDGLLVEFGKNRVQYRNFQWQYHTQGEFEVYYYQGGKELAGDIAAIVESAKERITPYFGNSLDGPIQILVYNNQAEFTQSNIGLFNPEDEGNNIGGNAKLVGNKLFVYGKGDRRELERDIVEGVARIGLKQILYRGSWQDAMRNSSILQIPDWFEEGLVSYISDPRSAEAKAYIYDAGKTGDLGWIERTYGEKAGKYGMGVWSYVADVYGKQAIANVIYMVRLSSSVEGGFRFATGMNLNELMGEVLAYSNRLSSAEYRDVINGIEERELGFNYQSSSKSPDGNTTAYITNTRGQLVVRTLNHETGEIRKRATHGKKLSQIGSGEGLHIAWHPNSNQFSYVINEKGEPQLITIRLNERSFVQKTLYRIDGVLSLDYSGDGRNIVFSGLREGRSDLYLYRVVGNIQEPLWVDRFDDLDPRFTNGGKSVIFASNRPDDTLRGDTRHIPFQKEMDLYLAHLDKDQIEIEKLVSTPLVDERKPVPLSNNDFIYLAEKPNGSQDLMWGWKDSTILSIDTIVRYRYYTDTRVMQKAVVPALGLECDTVNQIIQTPIILNNELYDLAVSKMPQTNSRQSSILSDHINEKGLVEDFVPPNWSAVLTDTQVDIRNYVFESEKREKPDIKEKTDDIYENPIDGREVVLKPSNYRLNYTLEKIQTQVSNAFGSQFYTPYDGNINVNPGIGNATELRISDLFEDKHIIAGFNIPANLSNSLFGLAYYNLEGQTDKMLSIQRQGTMSYDADIYALIETTSLFSKYRLTFPLDEVRSVRASIGLRVDRHVPQGTEMFTLSQPIEINEQFGGEIAYVYDDTRILSLNIREGTRAKVWSEYYVDTQKMSFGTLGFDTRKYIRLYSNSILAFRLAGSYSIGEDKLLHLLGGTDNVLLNFRTPGSEIDPDVSYAYQARITPLRGFSNNARNGSNAMVANAELRIPIWSTFNKIPASNDFLRHLQLVMFGDVGSAWNGLHPYSDDNGFNTTVIEQNPITITIDNNNEPILYDYGFGLRSRLLGYWVCADLAWGVDNKMIQPIRFSLSLNFDF
ncbi:MAG: hypothetical protein CL847_03940 [Crocinitomicaceae bacterium]|nr:hypothetical protein [Crocinitomicaceae bacterium]|tara:strand:+ start:2215 stop:5361 length:3147 start_codon:yes stop_codon:yes gene_type:complete